jgi:hypothetical protein
MGPLACVELADDRRLSGLGAKCLRAGWLWRRCAALDPRFRSHAASRGAGVGQNASSAARLAISPVYGAVNGDPHASDWNR